jgi:hypothetical protein
MNQNAREEQKQETPGAASDVPLHAQVEAGLAFEPDPDPPEPEPNPDTGDPDYPIDGGG